MEQEDNQEQDLELNEDDILEVIELGDNNVEDDLTAGLDEINVADHDMDENVGSGNENEDIDIRDDAQVTFTKHTGSVFSVSLDQVSKVTAVSGGEDDKAYVWQVASGKQLFECTGHKDSVTCTGFSYDSKLVATGDMSGVIKVWNVENQEQIWSFECEDLEWLDWHHSAHVLLAGTADGDVWMWKVPGGECKTLQNHGSRTTCGMFMKDGKRACVGYEDGSLKVWDLKKGTTKFHLTGSSGHTGSITCMDCHSDNVLAITGSEDSTAKIVNTNSGKVLSSLVAGFPSDDNGEDDSPPSIEAVGFSPVNPYVATASLSGVLAVWDLHSHTVRQQCKHEAGIVRLKWDAVSPMIYTCCLDGVVRLWDSRSGNCERELCGHTAEILDLAVSRDGQTVLTGSGDSTAKVFTTETVER